MNTRNAIEIISRTNPQLKISAIPGHFVTSHSHINFYIDITKIKHRHMMALAAAETMASQYKQSTVVDTIVCMDGSEVIGSFLAKDLSDATILSMNRSKNINVIAPEFNANNQMIFRENLMPMVEGKSIILLIASITTGKTIKRSIECINYYNGKVAGISAIFSAIPEIEGIKINALFTPEDIPHYTTYSMRDCPKCKEGVKIDALVNSFGYSQI